MEKQPIPKQMTPLYYTITSFVRILNLEKEDVNVGQSIKKFLSKVQKSGRSLFHSSSLDTFSDTKIPKTNKSICRTVWAPLVYFHFALQHKHCHCHHQSKSQWLCMPLITSARLKWKQSTSRRKKKSESMRINKEGQMKPNESVLVCLCSDQVLQHFRFSALPLSFIHRTSRA